MIALRSELAVNAPSGCSPYASEDSLTLCMIYCSGGGQRTIAAPLFLHCLRVQCRSAVNIHKACTVCLTHALAHSEATHSIAHRAFTHSDCLQCALGFVIVSWVQNV